MEKKTGRIIIRKTLFAVLWSIVFFVITSTCCLIYFSSTAYDFAEVDLIGAGLDDSGHPTRVVQTEDRSTMAKVYYGYMTMQDSDIFLGLFLFSVVVSAFGAYVGILPGTDNESLAEMHKKSEQENISIFLLSPKCPNCGEEVMGNFCANCGQDRKAAQELTLSNFIRQFIPEILNIDAKFFRTFRLLLTKPGFLTLEYLQARRERYTLPTQMYFVVAAAFFIVSTNLDLSTEALLSQSTIASQLAVKAKANNKPIELIKQQVDDTLENYIPFYTFFIVIAFAFSLKVMYPNWYYVEHLIFSLHFITYFLVLWMGLVLIASKMPALEALVPIFPLPYLYFALKNTQAKRVGWRFIPITFFFLFLFFFYVALTMSLLFFFL